MGRAAWETDKTVEWRAERSDAVGIVGSLKWTWEERLQFLTALMFRFLCSSCPQCLRSSLHPYAESHSARFGLGASLLFAEEVE